MLILNPALLRQTLKPPNSPTPLELIIPKVSTVLQSIGRCGFRALGTQLLLQCSRHKQKPRAQFSHTGDKWTLKCDIFRKAIFSALSCKMRSTSSEFIIPPPGLKFWQYTGSRTSQISSVSSSSHYFSDKNTFSDCFHDLGGFFIHSSGFISLIHKNKCASLKKGKEAELRRRGREERRGGTAEYPLKVSATQINPSCLMEQ